MTYFKGAAMGKEETVVMLERLARQVEVGEIDCVALRVFNADGTWEDVVLGGTEQERAEALANLRAQH